MRFHSLGSAGPLVSALGMGCIGMTGGFYGDADEDQAIATLNRALDLGCSFWDSSDAYGPHTNERLLGRSSHADGMRSSSQPSSKSKSMLTLCSAPSTANRIRYAPHVRPPCDGWVSSASTCTSSTE